MQTIAVGDILWQTVLKRFLPINILGRKPSLKKKQKKKQALRVQN